MTENPSQREELLLLIRSRHPIVMLRTLEEERAEAILRDICEQLIVPLFKWTTTRSLVNIHTNETISNTESPARALGAIAAADIEAVYLLKDLAGSLSDAVVRRYLLDLAPKFTCDHRSLLRHVSKAN